MQLGKVGSEPAVPAGSPAVWVQAPNTSAVGPSPPGDNATLEAGVSAAA